VVPSDQVYDRLAEKYKQVGFQHFRDILQLIMTPEEGAIVLELSEPMSPADLAKKMNVDEDSLTKKMDQMARRGLLFRGKEQYLAWRDAHQLNARVMFSADENIPSGLLELRRQDLRYSGQPYAEIDGWIKMFETRGIPLLRVIPSRLAINASPKIRPEQVLWYEDVVEMMRRAEKIGLVDCDCRRIYHRCSKPLMTCLHFSKNIIEYEIGRGGRMKAISVEEAIETCYMSERAGLVHNTPGNNASLAGVICNCCNDCCSNLEPGLHDGKMREIMSPSRYRPSVDREKCAGCQTCFKICPFQAIQMEKIPGSDKMKAKVSEAKCMGCGVCVLQCKKQALTLEIVRPPDHIPPKPVNMPVAATLKVK
jgi:Na+-translocating ferredoxin:NAD+ oxidoreductase subunit B